MNIDALEHRNGSRFRLHSLEMGMLRSSVRIMSRCDYFAVMSAEVRAEGRTNVGVLLCKRCFSGVQVFLRLTTCHLQVSRRRGKSARRQMRSFLK